MGEYAEADLVGAEDVFVRAEHAEAFRDRMLEQIRMEGDSLTGRAIDVAETKRLALVISALAHGLDYIGWEGPVEDSVIVPLPDAVAAEFAREWLEGERVRFEEAPSELPDGRVDWDAMRGRLGLMEYLADLREALGRPELPSEVVAA